MYTGWEYIHLNIVYLVTNKFEVGTNIKYFFTFRKEETYLKSDKSQVLLNLSQNFLFSYSFNSFI